MTTGVQVDGDRAVVVKRSPAATIEQLRREGERLRRASHPGVVQVLRSAPAADGWELRTAHAGRPLSTFDGRTAAQVAAVVAAVASTLADLHALGIVHGRLDASHVVVGDQGRPVLCGFGDGSLDARPEDDVAAVGRLLSSLLAGEEDTEPIPERWWRPRPRWSGWERRALLLLADQACAEPATRRPTARRLAAAITEAVPDVARVTGPPEPETPELDPIQSRRPTARIAPTGLVARRLGAAMAVAVVVVIVAFGMRRSGGSAVPPPPTVDEVSSSTTSSAAAVRTARPVPGSVLTVDGRRYRVGQDGDEVLVGDWDCDGAPTPALLRPATGEVFVFPTWADDGQLEVVAALQVGDAEGLVSAERNDGCSTLLVRTSSGDVPVATEVAQ